MSDTSGVGPGPAPGPALASPLRRRPSSPTPLQGPSSFRRRRRLGQRDDPASIPVQAPGRHYTSVTMRIPLGNDIVKWADNNFDPSGPRRKSDRAFVFTLRAMRAEDFRAIARKRSRLFWV